MKTSTCFIAMVGILVSGCASGPPQKMQTDDTRECAQNLTYDGSFIMGRSFKTSQYIHGVSKNIAVEKAARFLAAEGWAINNTDKELGIISASQTISYGKGKTAPLNVGLNPNEMESMYRLHLRFPAAQRRR